MNPKEPFRPSLSRRSARYAPQRHLRNRPHDRRRRHGRSLQRPRNPDRRRRGDQDASAGDGGKRGRLGVVPPRGVGASSSAARGHRPLFRFHGRAGAATAVPGHGIRRRPLAIGYSGGGSVDLRGAAQADAAHRLRPAGGARARHHSSRRVARQHHRPAGRRGAGQDHRFRHRAFDPAGRQDHHRRGLRRQGQLRLAGTARSLRQRGHGEIRYLQSRPGAVLCPDRTKARHGRQPVSNWSRSAGACPISARSTCGSAR